MERIKILVVRSINRGKSTFIEEQVQSLRDQQVAVDYFNIEGKGAVGYLSNIWPLRKKMKGGDYHLIHAHGGLSGLLANFQRRLPVVTTYHGTDVNLQGNVKYSRMAARLSAFNILTNARLNDILRLRQRYRIIPCGIDLKNFIPLDRDRCKQHMGLAANTDYILFSSTFTRQEKNAPLARQVVARLPNTELIELSGFTRTEVNQLINASRMLLMTSHYESAPLIVKETLACNRPVVSTDVGDVKQVLDEVEGSCVVDSSVEALAAKCQHVLGRRAPVESRPLMEKYSLPVIAGRVKDVYCAVIRDDL